MTVENFKKLKRKPREKTKEPNLLKVGDSYYYRRGKIEESLGRFRTEDEAITYKRIFEAKLDSIGALAFKFKAKDVFQDYADERERQFMGRIKGRRSLSNRTIEEMYSKWRTHLRPFFGNKKLAEIDSRLWNQYVQKSKVSDLANHRKVLGHFLRWCCAQGYLRVVPSMEIPEVERRKRLILKPDQIAAILRESSGDLLLFVSMYLFMGIRWSEIIRLRWSALNLDRGILVVRKETTRTRKERSIPINGFVLGLLRVRHAAFVEAGIKTPWVFPKLGDESQHRAETTITRPWHTMLRRAGLEGIKPHDLRATFEYHANKRADFTDTQREKMAGAAIEVQRRHYVSFEADDVRGLEDVVPVSPDLISEKIEAERTLQKETGKTRVSKNLSDEDEGSFHEGKDD